MSVLSSVASFSQNVNLGAKYAVNSTWLLNKQVGEDNNQSYTMTFGHDFGGIVHVKLAEQFGIKSEVLANTTIQKYSGELSGIDYKSVIELKTLDVPIMLTVGNKFYFEAGFVFSFINKAEYELSASNFSSYENVKENFEETNNAIAIGLVKSFEFGDGFHFLMGLRATKGVKDIKGINSMGYTKEELENLELTDYIDFGADEFKTSSLTVGLYVGLTLAL
ncbi:MAG: hypothetical protein A2W98_06180 [Bacteroidetes bacterium GWF2_33_38]|nr:MAG: hypothetical protein A2W98_06180 [Bacteroidetes bacterium GWF2_33_38]OFY74333.1 MAG: hypothetical protein A2265_09670 [Bacteroidetes bacterium RIFOXYA12_FULL_33_9]OFY88094.1 MAG: hypothetical protein A2236_06140 [Bacteroidetes bacterium RIFOXYA2_FULL_33_7]